MESLIVLGLIACLGAWCYAKGKRTGSIKGYNVGRARRRPRTRRRVNVVDSPRTPHIDDSCWAKMARTRA